MLFEQAKKEAVCELFPYFISQTTSANFVVPVLNFTCPNSAGVPRFYEKRQK